MVSSGPGLSIVPESIWWFARGGAVVAACVNGDEVVLKRLNRSNGEGIG